MANSRLTLMCFRKPLAIKLSPRARLDFIDILRFTGETWGQEQLFAYRDKMNSALQTLSHNPQLGHQRSDLPPTHLSFVVGSHLIVYRLDKESLSVVRILHQRMSLSRHL